jgi:hypothetical protein
MKVLIANPTALFRVGPIRVAAVANQAAAALVGASVCTGIKGVNGWASRRLTRGRSDEDRGGENCEKHSFHSSHGHLL